MEKKISRRTFLKIAGGALLLAGAGGVWYEQRALGRLASRVAGDVTGAIDASFVRQIVAVDNQTARTIMWQSAAAQKEAAVELRAEGGDVHDYSGWQELARNAYERNPDADFFINMGDLVDNGEDHRQWEAWFDAVAPLSANIPVAPIMGNHETYDQNWKVRLPKAYLAQFAVPEVGSEPFHRYYYSFDYGPAHFIVLNTQQDETNDFHAGLLDEQQAWFAEDIAASKAKKTPWNIVLMHKDPIQYSFQSRPGRAEGFSDDGRAWMPLFDAHGVDLVLSAHLHTYRNRGHIRNFQRDAGGPLYIITGVAGNVRYPNLWKDHSLDEVVAPQPEVDNYMTVKGDAQHIEIQSFQPDGSLIDTAKLEK